jgi:hypothetical protein
VAQSVTALFLAGLPETVPGRVSAGQLTGAFQCPHCGETITLVARFTDASLKDSLPSQTGVGHVTPPPVPTPKSSSISFSLDSNVSNEMKEVSSEKEVLKHLIPIPSGPIRPRTDEGGAFWAGKAQTAELPLETRTRRGRTVQVDALPLTADGLGLLDQPPPETAHTRRHGPVANLFRLTPPAGPIAQEEKGAEPEPKRGVPIPAQAFIDGYEICYGAKTPSEIRLVGEKNKGLLTGALATLHDSGADLSRLREWWSWFKGWATDKPHPHPFAVVSTWSRFTSEVEWRLTQAAPSVVIQAARTGDEQFDALQHSIEQSWASGTWRPGQ